MISLHIVYDCICPHNEPLPIFSNCDWSDTLVWMRKFLGLLDFLRRLIYTQFPLRLLFPRAHDFWSWDLQPACLVYHAHVLSCGSARGCSYGVSGAKMIKNGIHLPQHKSTTNMFRFLGNIPVFPRFTRKRGTCVPISFAHDARLLPSAPTVVISGEGHELVPRFPVHLDRAPSSRDWMPVGAGGKGVA